MKSATSSLLAALLLVAVPSSAQEKAESKTEPKNDEAQLIEDLKAVRPLQVEQAEALRVYGTLDDEEGRKLVARLHQAMTKVAGAFPLLDPADRPSTNRFFKLVLNERGAGFDGFRFRNSSAEPKNFAWVFAFESPCSMDHWFIAPRQEQQMRGFELALGPKLTYTNTPWSHLSICDQRVQFLRDASILPGQEYFIWFSFRDQRPAVIHLIFDLFPTAQEFKSRDVIDEAFDLKGIPLRSGRPSTQPLPTGIR